MDRLAAPTEQLIAAGSAHADVGDLRAPAATDAVDGVQPRLVAEPSTVDRLVATLGWAADLGLTVRVRGGGTKQQWGAVAQPFDLLLSTARLNAVVEHRHGDLTATIEAGATLAAVNAALADHAQWLPLDPLWPVRATIGGIVATNDSGPARHHHGAPRDLIIGCAVVLADGRAAKSGGIVVKNVAGYDLARLMTGSFGTLAVITSATFKLAPVASSSRTVSIALDSLEDAAELIGRLADAPLTPSALELEWSPARLHVRFESVEAAVTQQAAEVVRLAGGSGRAGTLEDEAESRLWADYAGGRDGPGTLVKLATRPTELVPALVRLRDACKRGDVEMTAAGRAALGVVEVRLDGSAAAQARVIEQLRESLPPGEGSAVVRQAEPELRRLVDPWGSIGDALPIMQRIKAQLDPDGRLNPGGGPGGI